MAEGDQVNYSSFIDEEGMFLGYILMLIKCSRGYFFSKTAIWKPTTSLHHTKSIIIFRLYTIHFLKYADPLAIYKVSYALIYSISENLRSICGANCSLRKNWLATVIVYNPTGCGTNGFKKIWT